MKKAELFRRKLVCLRDPDPFSPAPVPDEHQERG
jgi:hypothetical protein